MGRRLLQNATVILLQNTAKVYYKMRELYYEMQQLLQNVIIFYKMWQLSKNVTYVTKCVGNVPPAFSQI